MGNTAQERQYVRDLAQATVELFDKGHMTPNAEDIAQQHYQGRSYGPATVEDIRKKLPALRTILEEDYDRRCCLVARPFYTKFQHIPPVSVIDARTALPIGNGKRSEGIHALEGPDDLIWQASEQQGMALGAGRVRASADRTLTSFASGQLTATTTEGMLKRAYRQAADVNSRDTLSELLSRPDAPELEAGEG